MATHGSMEEFSGKGWSSWAERLQYYFEANGIKDDAKKRAVLLTLCGPTTFETVKALVAPKTPSEFSCAELVTMLQTHYDPRPSELFSRCRFQRRDQLPDETVTVYVAALKKLAADCNFGTVQPAVTSTATTGSGESAPTAGSGSTPTTVNVTMLPMDVMLRDRFVCGLRDEYLQQRLFAERDLTFSKAFDIAVRAENAKDHQRQIKEDFKEVNKAEKSRNSHQREKTTETTGTPCYRCEGLHSPSSCKFRTSQCRYCKKTGHIAKACMKKKKSASSSAVHVVDPRGTCDSTAHGSRQPSSLHDLNSLQKGRGSSEKLMVNLKVEGAPLRFEVDSGAALSLISEETFRSAWPRKPPQFTQEDVALRTWSGEHLESLGTIQVVVQFKGIRVQLPLLVMKRPGCNLLGRNWFQPLGIGLSGVHQVVHDRRLMEIIEKHAPIFDADLNQFKGPAVSLELQEKAAPKFLRARTVPFALKPAVEAELQRLTDQGILEQTQHSEWATPVVLVRKKDGSIRLCGDYRSTVNSVTRKAAYPLPTVPEVLAKLRGGKVFSTLDLAQAYQQLKVTESTADILTINTIKGLYRVKRLPFGVSAAPAVFQRCIDTTLAGLPGVSAYLDDIIVTGATPEEHAQRLDSVLTRLQEVGLRAQKAKCRFGVAEVTYLGHRIDAAGVHATDEKLKAIKELPEPTSKATLQSFLGMLAFYDRFMENRATVACELYKLLEKNSPWRWEEQHAVAFRSLKELLLQETTLAHYDDSKPLLLSCDASPYGVGAVLAQVDQEGREAPIAFASRTLGEAERNYSQLDREGLAVVFGAVHFHQYIAGRKVVIITDHQPLLGILGSQKPIPQVLSPRMRRWCVKLSAYDYQLVYRPGKKHQNADALSRLPLPESEDEPCPPGDVLMIETAMGTPLTADRIAGMTQADPVLSRVFQAVQRGNLHQLKEATLLPFFKKRTELSTQRGCLIWGSRVVVPEAARADAMKLLHAGHKGIVAMKMTARSHMWWPAINNDIENVARSCIACQESRPMPKKAPLPTWDHPSKPWDTIHLDFAGPLEGQMFLVIVDAVTKWLEVRYMTTATSAGVIRELRSLFATFGLPRKVVSDNGTVFVSKEMMDFYHNNGIQAVTSAPYHPATNGQAERMVYELKQGLAKEKKGLLSLRLARFLYKQHTTVSSSTGKTPASMMFGRELTTNISRLMPSPESDKTPLEEKMPTARIFKEGQHVVVYNFRGVPKWIQGTLVKRIGRRSWLVETAGGRIRRHLNHIRKGSSPSIPSAAWSIDGSDCPPACTVQQNIPTRDTMDGNPDNVALAPPSVHPPRTRRPPDRYGHWV